MSRRHWLPLAAALVVATAAASAGASERAAGPAGEIVFTSDRATANPGEIYALGPGAARRNVTDSPYADVALATSPKGRAFAFWSNRTGPWRLMLSADGSSLRTVAIGGPAGPETPSGPPVFSADGTRVLIPFLARDSITQRPEYALVTARSGPALELTMTCGPAPALSPDGRLIACAAPGGKRVSVLDESGRVRFGAPGKSALWSADGRLAVAGAKRTEVLSAAGRPLAKLSGVARAWSPDGSTLALTRPGTLVLARPGRPGPPHVVYAGGNGTPYWVAFTPDGRTIVFAGGFGDAQMAAVSGGRVRAFAGQPFGAWSRDGRYASTVATGATVRIEVGDQLGRKARVLGRFAYDDMGVSSLAWLGDGSALLYNGSTLARRDLWTMRADGSAERRLTGAPAVSAPAWSAAGTKLAYSAPLSSGEGRIVVADARGRRLSILAGVEPGDGDPSWSPAGTKIAVAATTAGGISVIDVASGSRSSLAVDGIAPAWSPDGTRVAFVDLDDGTVWGATPTGADRHRLLPPSVRSVTALTWSPDGKRLAFSTRTGIYIAAAGEVGSARLVTAARLPGRPSFSPDGARLAYAADAGSPHRYRAVFAVALDGSGKHQLTTGPYDSSDPAWRP